MTTIHKETPIKFINPLDEEWESYVNSNDQATIFHHPSWIKTISHSYNYRPFAAVIIDADENIQAGIPFVEVNSMLTGKRWVSVSFSDHCTPLYNDQQALNTLILELGTMVSKGLVPKIELRWMVPDSLGDWSYSSQVLHTVPLSDDAAYVKKNIRKMHRRNIKTAQKRGVEIKRGTSEDFLDAFYSMHLETRKRHGIPIQPKKFFKLIHKNLLEPGLGFITLAFVDDEYIASAIYLHFKKTLVYKYGASKESGRNYRPNNLIFWDAIEWGINNGCTSLDLGKTGLENKGLRNFKDGWGAEEKELIYSVMPQAQENHGGGFLKTGMEKIISISPEWVCRATGEILYRHFG